MPGPRLQGRETTPRDGEKSDVQVDNRGVAPLSLLIIDDSPTELLAARRSLESEGFQVFTCLIRSFSEVLHLSELVLAVVPDVILMDVDLGLSCYDGVKLVRTVRRLSTTSRASRDPLIILHSSLPPAKLEALKAESGADSYLEKGEPGLLPLRVKTLLTIFPIRPLESEAP